MEFAPLGAYFKFVYAYFNIRDFAGFLGLS